MANTNRQFEIARDGVEAWNDWRRRYPEEKVDFSNVDFTLEEDQGISFAGFEFGNKARFDGATFGYRARFDGATFGDEADFESTTFGKWAVFMNATFGDRACFNRSTFGAWARFENVTFGDSARFDRATFEHWARFKGATFGDEAYFNSATFGDSASFENATFGIWNDFENATFGDETYFDGATFKGSVLFNGGRQKNDDATDDKGAEQSSSLNGPCTYFRAISFSRTEFHGEAAFGERTFQDAADFSNAKFSQPPDFRATQQRENLDWTGTRFGFGGHLTLGRSRIPVRSWTTQSDAVASLRRLRGIAKEIHAVDAERDLFILERRAERGILWRVWWDSKGLKKLIGWWRPLTATILMFLYSYSSNCGRSVFLPVLWVGASNWGFYHLYAFLIDQPLRPPVKSAVFDFTFSSAIPFGATTRPAFQSAVETLFKSKSANLIDIPWQIQAASTAQGTTNLVLIFLLGLALRNYFKFR